MSSISQQRSKWDLSLLRDCPLSLVVFITHPATHISNKNYWQHTRPQPPILYPPLATLGETFDFAQLENNDRDMRLRRKTIWFLQIELADKIGIDLEMLSNSSFLDIAVSVWTERLGWGWICWDTIVSIDLPCLIGWTVQSVFTPPHIIRRLSTLGHTTGGLRKKPFHMSQLLHQLDVNKEMLENV